MNKALAHRPRRSSQSPVGATKKSPSHGDAGDGAPNGPVGLLICEVTRRGGLSDKGPCRSRASCYGNRAEGNYYLTLAPASAAGAFLFSESRQPGPHDRVSGRSS
jgi:hypothetical protein